MSRLYASIRGQAKTVATRRAHKTGTIEGHIRGWDSGVRVYGKVNETGQDCFYVYQTSGNNGAGNEALICRIIDGKLETA